MLFIDFCNLLCLRYKSKKVLEYINKIIVENIEKLDFNELKELQSLFDHFSDSEIFSMIINNKYVLVSLYDTEDDISLAK